MEDKLKEIIAEYLGIKVKDIELDMNIVEDLGINSYDIISIVGEIEEIFDMEISENDIRGFKTVGDVLDYITKVDNV